MIDDRGFREAQRQYEAKEDPNMVCDDDEEIDSEEIDEGEDPPEREDF